MRKKVIHNIPARKPDFMIAKNWQNVILDMTDEQAGKVLKMLYELNINGLEPPAEYFSDPELKWFYKGFVLPYTDRSIKRYMDICGIRKAAGKKGGLIKAANREKSLVEH